MDVSLTHAGPSHHSVAATASQIGAEDVLSRRDDVRFHAELPARAPASQRVRKIPPGLVVLELFEVDVGIIAGRNVDSDNCLLFKQG
jgi:hypothetical protein